MKRTSSITKKAAASHQGAFEEIVDLIEQSRLHAAQAVNTTLIDLYWNVGKYISSKIQSEGWGKGTVLSLATFVQKRQPGIRGFSPQNIWRMRQFFETYRDQPVLSPLLRELPWSSNLHILSRSKRPEEREFYLKMASRNHWQVREVARQMDAALFDRSVLHPPKLSNVTPMLATSYSPQRLRRNPAIMSKKCFLNRKPNPKWRSIFILKANCRLLIINN